MAMMLPGTQGRTRLFVLLQLCLRLLCLRLLCLLLLLLLLVQLEAFVIGLHPDMQEWLKLLKQTHHASQLSSWPLNSSCMEQTCFTGETTLGMLENDFSH